MRAAPQMHEEAPYQAFIAASLVLGVGGGFLLSVLLPLARTLDWGWGATARWGVMVQVHGQLQLIGFAGLFVMGMALRLSPRISGRPLASRPLIPLVIPSIAGYLVLRSFAQPLDDGVVRDAALAVSAGLFMAGAIAFAAIVWRTVLHPDSRAEATGYFFVLGAAGVVAGSIINALQTYDMVRQSLDAAPATRQAALVFEQNIGFLMFFIGGVGTRAVPHLTGFGRNLTASRIAAVALAAGVTLFTGYLLVAAERRPPETLVRAGDAGIVLTGVAFAMLVWLSGALWPRSRVAAASRTQFWFVRSAFAWLLVAALLAIWYGARAFREGRPPDQFELDAFRHVLTIGVITMLIIGMAMLVVPEFAGRRIQHRDERWPHRAMIVALNVAAALRFWPPLEGTGWLGDTRFWPMAVAGVLAAVVVAVFAAMFAQSWWEQRDPSWSARAAGIEPSMPGR
jgi:hypothetical protein